MTCSNETHKRAKRASASGIVIFLEYDSFSLYFTQISLNSLNFWIISFSFLKFPWNSLNFWNSLKNSLRRSKFLTFCQKKEISLKVEALYWSIASYNQMSQINVLGWGLLQVCTIKCNVKPFQKYFSSTPGQACPRYRSIKYKRIGVVLYQN